MVVNIIGKQIILSEVKRIISLSSWMKIAAGVKKCYNNFNSYILRIAMTSKNWENIAARGAEMLISLM